MVGAFSAGLADVGVPGSIVRQVTTPSALVRSALVVLDEVARLSAAIPPAAAAGLCYPEAQMKTVNV